MLGVNLSISEVAALGTGGEFGWLVRGPDGALPLQVSAWSNDAGFVGGRVYAKAAAYLAAAGGTFSRASDAWRRDADGLWRKSGSHALRLHHDASGNRLGALIEGQRNFFLRPSRTLTGSEWTKRGTCTVSQDMGVAAADGVLGAMRVAGLGNAGVDDIYRSLSGAPVDTICAAQIMLRRVSTSGTLALTNPYGSALGRWLVNLALLPDGWERVTRTHPAVTVLNEFSTASSSGGYGLQLSAAIGGPLTVHADFANIEMYNAWASSPMDPSGGATTRLADALSFPAATPAETTIVIDAVTAPGLWSQQVVHCWDDGSSDNRLRVYRNADAHLMLSIIRSGAVSTYQISTTPLGDAAEFKLALSLKAGTVAAALDGAAPRTWSVASPIPSGMTTIRTGNVHTGEWPWFGIVSRESRYAKAYSASELQAMSS